MKRDSRRDDRGRRGRARQVRPGVEGLEGRQLLYAAVGAAWPHPNLITYSVVPDGTNIGGSPSNLIGSFNSRWSQSAWVAVLEQAAAVWEQVANINIIPVGDNGTPMGNGPDQQGDPNMGDIRISGLPSSVLGTGTLAYTLYPPPINGGSEAGDIIFNTSQLWAINNNYDLLTVAIHEFGHALGLGESQIQQAVMYGTYTNINQSLSGDDIAGIQSIYGARSADAFMANYNNSSSATAANLMPFFNSTGQFAYGSMDLQTSTQSEWFKVTVPANSSGSMLVTMQAGNLSLLSPGLVAYNASLQYIGYAGTYNTPGNTVSVRLNGLVPGQVYYIQATGYGSSWYSDGNYGLEINFQPDTNPLSLLPRPVTTTPAQASVGGGGSYDNTEVAGTGPDPGWLHRIETSHGPRHANDSGQGDVSSDGRSRGSQAPTAGPSGLFWLVPPPQPAQVVTIDLDSLTFQTSPWPATDASD